MKILVLIMLVLMSFQILISKEFDNTSITKKHKMDVCDLFLDSKPILFYDYLYGIEINSTSFFVPERIEQSQNYQYEYDEGGRISKKIISHKFEEIIAEREYYFNETNLLTKVVEKRESFEKKIEFVYSKNKQLKEIKEYISSELTEIKTNYDYYLYKFNKNGSISCVYGVNEKFLGFSHEYDLLKIYDYDEKNRLKSIRDFKNPNNNIIISFDEFVIKD